MIDEKEINRKLDQILDGMKHKVDREDCLIVHGKLEKKVEKSSTWCMVRDAALFGGITLTAIAAGVKWILPLLPGVVIK